MKVKYNKSYRNARKAKLHRRYMHRGCRTRHSIGG